MKKRKPDPLPTITAETREAAEAWILAHYPPSPPEPPVPLPTASISADEVGSLPIEAQIYPLYLWLVERPYPKPAWDVTNAVVITAGTEQLAREYFPLNFSEKEPDLDRSVLLVTRVGIALPGAEPGVYICTDFQEA